MMRFYIFALLTFILSFGCATYYEQNYKLQSLITSGQIEAADKMLDKDKKGEDGKDRVLYFYNRGTVAHMNGQYEKSNSYFTKADYYVEDFRKSLGPEALALISNPMTKPYKPEDFEAVMAHYYMTLNYIYLKNYEGALVECRRMNIQLQTLNDKYKKNKNKYSDDAFAHTLMGLIYEASGDYNNAFIAYRNALDVYESDYKDLFLMSTPLQLKKDILRTAKHIGFFSELDFYERKFNMKCEEEDLENGYLVLFWMNGFGPVKAEWSINFVNTGYDDGWVTFANEEHGLSFPIYIGNKSRDEQNAFADLSMLRVAFPKYVERKTVFQKARINVNGESYPLEMAENINAIAFQCLKDRMAREIANSIMRLATKKAMEAAARNENENLGAIVSIVNAMTEKADTRNWQSLPHSISYARIPLPEGTHQVDLQASGQANSTVPLEFNITKGQTTFFAFHHLESQQTASRY